MEEENQENKTKRDAENKQNTGSNPGLGPLYRVSTPAQKFRFKCCCF
jgi:hypothetical protein